MSLLGKYGSRGRGDKTGKAANTPTARPLAVRVKTARKRSHSSTQWLERQLNDPYVAEAKRQGWRSRAAFKLIQLNDRYHFLRAGQRVVDLGAAPGGWTQVAVKIVKPEEGNGGQVIGIDMLEMEEVAGATIFQGDFTEEANITKLKEMLHGNADVVLSDMAAPTTGHNQTDHLRIVALAEIAIQFALDTLAPNGVFVCKLFQGGAEKHLFTLLQKHFSNVKHAKPPASRADSVESYVVATGFRLHK